MCGIAALLRAIKPPSTVEGKVEEGMDGQVEGSVTPDAAVGGAEEASGDTGVEAQWRECLRAAICPRGPDMSGSAHIEVAGGGAVDLLGQVLHMRGEEVQRQPVADEDGNMLLWNGEVWTFGDNTQLPTESSDTIAVRDLLSTAASEGDEGPNSLVSRLQQIDGPWSIVFWNSSTSTLWYARDRWGRRSLVVAGLPSGGLAVSSVAASEQVTGLSSPDPSVEWSEVEPIGLYRVRWDSEASAWHECAPVLWTKRVPSVVSCHVQPNPTSVIDERTVDVAATGLLVALASAVRLRTSMVPKLLVDEPGVVGSGASVAVLFSGGLDSSILAFLCHFCVPSNEPIDLINVCFDKKHASPDRRSAIDTVKELRELLPSRQWNLIRVDADFGTDVLEQKGLVCGLMDPGCTHMDFNIGSALWFASRGLGECFIHEPSADVDSDDVRRCHDVLAGAFKVVDLEPSKSLGGMLHIDITGLTLPNSLEMVGSVVEAVLRLDAEHAATAAASVGSHAGAAAPPPPPASKAKLACKNAGCRGRYVKPGCLRNVCGKCCRKLHVAGLPNPDDIVINECRVHRLGKKRVEKAKAAWRTRQAKKRGEVDIAVATPGADVPVEHKTEAGAKAVSGTAGITHHASEETEDTAGVAGAGRVAPVAEGIVDRSDSGATSVRMRSTAKALILGSGADEQMAGYGRHRTAFKHKGWPGLHQELTLDLERLWKRNLGRDDRCCSHHGKEPRTPFLDERVTTLLSALPLHVIADLRLDKGVGDKRVLRRVAMIMGLQTSTVLPKRAIQFGSRIAKQSNIHAFGSNRAASGDAKFE